MTMKVFVFAFVAIIFGLILLPRLTVAALLAWCVLVMLYLHFFAI
jgi:hypothetical protein